MAGDSYEIMKKIRADMNLFLDNSLKEAVHVILPGNFSRTFLMENKPNDIDEQKWLSGCYYIVHTIIQLGLDKRYANTIEMPLKELQLNHIIPGSQTN